MECVYAAECANVDKSCFKCFGYSLYKPHKVRQGLRPKSQTKKEVKEGMDFENRGTRKYNQTMKIAKEAARRQLNSGAMAHALGDMITEEELTASLSEFKERGTTSASGQKQITIKRDWLEKLEWEAKQMGKDHYFLPFTFKGSDKDYVAMDFEIFMSYIQMIHALNEQNRLLRMQLGEGDD